MDDLRDKLEFVTTEIIYDGAIPISEKEVVAYTCRCNYLDVSGREFNAADTIFTEIKASFRVRYCKFTKDLNVNTEKYKIKYNNNLYDIKFSLDYKNQHKYIDIKATLVK